MEMWNVTDKIINRVIQGSALEEDFALLRRLLIVNGHHNVVQIGKYNINIAEGIENTVLQEEIRNIICSIEQSRYDSSLREYFHALSIYSEKFPYFTVADLLSNENKGLDAVYVPLQAQTAIKNRAGAAHLPSEQVSLDTMLHGATTSVEFPHALLLGEPGAGKSTLLRQIARHAWNDPDSLGLDRPHLPLVVRLQSLALVEGVSLEERLINALRRDGELLLEQSPPGGFLATWSQSMETSWLLLLDGFDEVPASQLSTLLRWLEDVLVRAAETKRYHILLTSRPLGEVPPLFQKKFKTYELLPFSSKQQAMLAEHWLHESKEPFLHQLARIQSGFLAQTPLLLTVAIAVFKTNGYLVEHTVELYKQFIAILLTEAERRGMRDELGIEQLQVYEGLAYLALIMTTSPEKTSLDELSQALLPYLSQIFPAEKPHTSIARSKKFIEVVGRRSGVFRSQKTGTVYTWLHPTFREFFTAYALMSTNATRWHRLVKKRWKQNEWQESMLFFLALLSRKGVNITRFARQLLRRRTWTRYAYNILDICCYTIMLLCCVTTNGWLKKLEILINNDLLSMLLLMSVVCFLLFWLIVRYRKDFNHEFNEKKDSLFLFARLLSFCDIDHKFKHKVIKRLLKETLKVPLHPPGLPSQRHSVGWYAVAAEYDREQKKRAIAQSVLDAIDRHSLKEVLEELSSDKDSEIRSGARFRLKEMECTGRGSGLFRSCDKERNSSSSNYCTLHPTQS